MTRNHEPRQSHANPPAFGESRLDALQHHAFEYFLHETNPANGLVADKSQQGSPASIAAVGFALAVYVVDARATQMASGSTTVFRYRANVTPPRDGRQWATLMGTLVGHWVSRYGVGEVRDWFFEVWNEPNLKAFWTGTQQDYFDLYRHTVDAIKAVDAQLRVGGPATAKNEWIEEFLDFCDQHGLPADFVSTHHYPTDALGNEDQETETHLSNSRRSLFEFAGPAA